MEEKWRDLLRLPLLQPDAWQDDFSKPRRGSLSNGAYRRQTRRAANVISANRVINAVIIAWLASSLQRLPVPLWFRMRL